MASQTVPRHVVLTGIPGVGKTTLIKEVCQMLRNVQVPVQGFYTEEIRDEQGKRSGFDVVTLDGSRGPLARVKRRDDFPTNRREYLVGQYSVQLKEFESVAIPSVKKMGTVVCVIDEIGKMELFSQTFCRTVQKLLDDPSSTVFCTIPVPKGKPLPLVDQVRNRKDIILIEVTRQNRNDIAQDIYGHVRTSHTEYSQKS